MDDLLNFILKEYPFVQAEDMEQVFKLGVRKTYDAGDVYIHCGEKRQKLGIIEKGLIRGYYIHENGNESTLIFAAEGEIAAAHELIFKKEPAKQIVEILEPSIIWSFDFQEIEALAAVNERIRELKHQFFQRFLVKVLDRLENFLIQNPEGRYQWFLDRHPDLVQRVQQRHFASFLGITPVSLSRIRARLSKKNN